MRLFYGIYQRCRCVYSADMHHTAPAVSQLSDTVDYGPSIKSQLANAINFRVLCGANLVTLPPENGGPETYVVHRVG